MRREKDKENRRVGHHKPEQGQDEPKKASPMMAAPIKAKKSARRITRQTYSWNGH